jgi:hypothetical protein
VHPSYYLPATPSACPPSLPFTASVWHDRTVNKADLHHALKPGRS